MTELTESDKKRLTEFLGNKYVYRKWTDGLSVPFNRPFTTPQDRHDLVVALHEKGLWYGFFNRTRDKYMAGNQYYGEFTLWLMVEKPERCIWLISEFLKGEGK
jgi:hypothetical protein